MDETIGIIKQFLISFGFNKTLTNFQLELKSLNLS